MTELWQTADYSCDLHVKRKIWHVINHVFVRSIIKNKHVNRPFSSRLLNIYRRRVNLFTFRTYIAVQSGEVRVRMDGQLDERSKAVRRGEVKLKEK